MPQKTSVQSGSSVDVMCFAYSNPSNINGGFGTFQLWVDRENVEGRMTISVLLDLPSTITLNLKGTCRSTHKKNHCHLKGTGYTTEFGAKSVRTEAEMKIVLEADWSKGEIFFDKSTDGLPVARHACTQAS